MTGYRVGWTRCSPALASQLTKIQEPLVSCASPFNQLAAAVALREGHSAVEDMRRQYHKRRNIALNILKQRGRESSYVPGGAFYLPVDVSSSGKPQSFLHNLNGLLVYSITIFDYLLNYFVSFFCRVGVERLCTEIAVRKALCHSTRNRIQYDGS